jgi:hypothetical protein
LHQSRTADAWWFMWVRKAELLRACCARAWLSRRRDELWVRFSSLIAVGNRTSTGCEAWRS